MATRKYRAGVNLRDPVRSGFARVDILSQEDLFPDQGYEFKNGKTKITNSYKVSTDSPFTTNVPHKIADKTEEEKIIEKQMPDLIRTERLCTIAEAKAIAAPVDGELRPLHSKIVAQAVYKERQQQMTMNEQRRIAKMKDDAKWVDAETREAEATCEFYKTNGSDKRAKQQRLAEIYKKEIALHKKHEQDRLALEKEEAERDAKIQAEAEQREKEALRKKKEEERKRVTEFEKLNTSLLNRKKLRMQQEHEIDLRVQKEKEQQEAQQAARAEYLQKIKDEKNRLRERNIMRQAKILQEMQKKEDTTLENAQSEIALREEQERQAEVEKRRQMMIRRNMDWKKSLKARETKDADERRRKMESPFSDDGSEDYRAAEAISRKENERKIRAAQARQIQERKAREAKERQQELSEGANYYFLKDNEW